MESAASTGLRPQTNSRALFNAQQLKPTASQELILRKMFISMDVPEQDRKIPGNRFEAHRMIVHYTARHFEFREYRHQEQLKDIRPSGRQLQDIMMLWDDLMVPEDKRKPPETKGQALNVYRRLDTTKEERNRLYKVSIDTRSRHNADPQFVPSPGPYIPKPPGAR